MKKRYSTPKAKPNQLKVQWGHIPHETIPEKGDLTYVWGDGVSRSDSIVIHDFFTNPRYRHPWDKNTLTLDLSFIEELEKRGYDITTLKFSISKKEI